MTFIKDNLVELALAAFGLLTIARSGYGIAVKKLITHGRGGRQATYLGRDAVRQGIFMIVFGSLFVLFAAYSIVMKLYS